MHDFHGTFRDLLHATNLRHGTDGFTSPPKEGVLKIFFARKNPTASARFEHANLGTKGQHATPRPPKPQKIILPIIKLLYSEILRKYSVVTVYTICNMYGLCLLVLLLCRHGTYVEYIPGRHNNSVETCRGSVIYSSIINC